MKNKYKVWTCKIVVSADEELPNGFDYPPRMAAENAIAKHAKVLMNASAWGGTLTQAELEHLKLQEQQGFRSDVYFAGEISSNDITGEISSDNKNNNIVKIVDKTKSSLSQSPEQILLDALDMVHEKKIGAYKNGIKMLTIMLDDTNGRYDINYINAGMSCSEAIALCELTKDLFKDDMTRG